MTRASMQDTTVVEASRSPIKSVKLFGSRNAEITRTFPLSFPRSQDEPQVVEIVHLPVGLLSVDVSVTSASGNVTILDHYHTALGESVHVPFGPFTFAHTQVPDHRHTCVARHPFENPTSSSQTLRELETERLRLEDDRRLRQQSFTFLTTYMDSLGSRALRITKEKERLSKLSKGLPVKVVAVLSCNSQMPVEAVELTVTYVVIQVSWKPTYNVHIAMTGNTPSPTVRLDFRCMATQWTGENWENVWLALTTADQVSQLTQLPEPRRIDTSLGPTQLPATGPIWHSQPKAASIFFGGAQIQIEGPRSKEVAHDRDKGHRREIQRVRDGVFDDQLLPPQELHPGRSTWTQLARIDPYVPSEPPAPVVDEVSKVDASSQIVSQLISHGGKDPITHIANGYIFIPSDHAEHHVLVASPSLLSEFKRAVAPGTDTRVYYICEVRNTSEYALPPGTVKTYLNDKHVSSTDIHNTELPQILECSLAIDPGVKTVHNRTVDTLPSFGAFTAKATTTYTSTTVIHNTHTKPIRGVIVRGSIPLPTDPRITVVLKEPAGLAEMDEGSVSVREGCLALWSTAGGRKGKQAGLFEWVCDVNPGTEVLKTIWNVCVPKDLTPFEQVRS